MDEENYRMLPRRSAAKNESSQYGHRGYHRLQQIADRWPTNNVEVLLEIQIVREEQKKTNLRTCGRVLDQTEPFLVTLKESYTEILQSVASPSYK